MARSIRVKPLPSRSGYRTAAPGVVCTTAATAGTLQATGGVSNPSAPQNYGALCSPPSLTFRNFTFTVDPQSPCGGTLTASLQMQDGATNYGTLTYTFVTGTLAVALAEDFDGVTAPELRLRMDDGRERSRSLRG